MHFIMRDPIHIKSNQIIIRFFLLALLFFSTNSFGQSIGDFKSHKGAACLIPYDLWKADTMHAGTTQSQWLLPEDAMEKLLNEAKGDSGTINITTINKRLCQNWSTTTRLVRLYISIANLESLKA